MTPKTIYLLWTIGDEDGDTVLCASFDKDALHKEAEDIYGEPFILTRSNKLYPRQGTPSHVVYQIIETNLV